MPRLPRLASPRFNRWLIAAVAVGLIVRLINVFSLRHVGNFLIGDAVMYHGEGNVIADGHGWIDPLFFGVTGFERQMAMHPPAYPAYLALWSALGMRSVLGHQLATVPIGLVSVVVIGIAGRRFFSPEVGIVAALIAAVHPSFWSWDGMVLQESLAIVAALLLLLAYRALLKNPSRRAMVAAGLASGFAPLVRAELLAGVVLAALLVLWRHGLRRGAPRVLGAAAIAIACIAPWTIYNAARFHAFVPLSNGFGMTLASTHCADLDGNLLGYWSLECQGAAANAAAQEWAAAHPDARQYPMAESTVEWQNARAGGQRILPPGFESLQYPDFNEAVRDAAVRARTIEWIKRHPGFEARAVLARVGRVLGLYRPIQQIELDTVPDGRKRPIAIGAWIGYFALLPFAVAGAVMAGRGRQRDQALLILIPLVVVLITAAMTFGSTRYRAIAEPTFALFAAASLVPAAAWVRRTLAARYGSSG